MSEHPAARELVDALIAADDARPRSQQVGPGFSSLGGCSRRVWHEIRGDAKCNPNVKRLPAILGTAIHEYIEDLSMLGLREVKVRTPGGLPGTADRIHDGVLSDWKTTKLKSLEWVRVHGPSTQQVWQVMTYAYAWNSTRSIADFLAGGDGVHTVRLIYIPRDGTEDDIYVWEAPYDERIALEALDWLEEILEQADAGHRPPPEKDPAFCADWCPFYGELCKGIVSAKGADAQEIGTDDPWLEDAAAAYYQAVKDEKAAAARKAAALDALSGASGRVGAYRVSWVHRKGSSVLDADAVREDYTARGQILPVKTQAGSTYPQIRKVQ